MKWVEWVRALIGRRPEWAEKIPRWLWVLIVLASTSAFVLVIMPGGPPPDELPDFFVAKVEGDGGGPQSFATGWVADPDASDAFAGTLEFPSFAETPAGHTDDLPKSVYLWSAYHKIYGRAPPPQNQGSVGSCVSFGTSRAIERTLAVQIALQGRGEEFHPLVEEVSYAGSRVEVGGGRIRGDGSIGAWAAEFSRKWGVVRRGVHGSYDLTTYSPERARSWGRSGVPDDLEPIARQHPVKDVTRVNSWDEAKRALASGYGIAICSDVGFAGMRRDSRGILNASGSWAHCMALDGYHIEANGAEWGHIENSWGADAHSGPVGWGDPNTAGFWTSSKTIDRMLAQKDSWAFADVKGFPARKIDWFAMLPPTKPHQAMVADLLAPQKEMERWFVLAP